MSMSPLSKAFATDQGWFGHRSRSPTGSCPQHRPVQYGRVRDAAVVAADARFVLTAGACPPDDHGATVAIGM
jgi:hypothetical protein